MKVAILTQPLLANYGGILQNYALQQVLKELGHDPVTLDYTSPIPIGRYFRSVLRFLLKGAPYMPLFPKRQAIFDDFVREHIDTVPAGHRYRKSLLDGIDAIVVGSDQVWRPLYNRYILRDMFLDFAGSFPGIRIAYAASFGSESWDVGPSMAHRCSVLARKFDAISVREPSGVRLCREILGVEAMLMPDPVLLLKADDYLKLCEDIPTGAEEYIAAYILDGNEETDTRLDQVRKESGLPLKRFTANRDASLSVPQWLAAMRDASIIVTDSFHGAVIAKLFGKPCSVIENAVRGRERFELIKTMEGASQKGRDFLKKYLKND